VSLTDFGEPTGEHGCDLAVVLLQPHHVAVAVDAGVEVETYLFNAQL
jgi:hypothetical protein